LICAHYITHTTLLIKNIKLISLHLTLPVVTADVGNWDIRRIVLAGKLDASIRLGLIKMMEAAGSLSAEIQKTKPEASQWNMCGNLQGYNLRKHGCLACMKNKVYYA